MGRFARILVGSGCVGGTYQSIKKVIKSDSILKSGFYSALAALFGTGAYKFLSEREAHERLEQLLAQEDPEEAEMMRRVLYQKVPQLEGRVQTREEQRDYIGQVKKQIIKERGHRYG